MAKLQISVYQDPSNNLIHYVTSVELSMIKSQTELELAKYPDQMRKLWGLDIVRRIKEYVAALEDYEFIKMANPHD